MRPIAAVRQVWLTEADCDLDTFRTLVEQSTDPVDHPSAERVEHGVPLYDSDRLRALTATPQGLRDVQAELARTLMDGPGIVVFKGAFTDPAVVDRASAVFRELIEEERAAGTARGDHFAKPGANDRVWSALDKLAVRAPDVFADYYANDILALVAEAWLGPAYQVTSQVNVVNPGGAAQSPHRDYHLGFLTRRQAAGYPAHVHRLSPVLTLQGAVAHCDMPVESGPTLYLPHSQKYEPGYLAWRLPEFVEYFDIHHIQLPLDKGDAAFFNPALFHAAGHNRSSDVRRMANLLQISSAFGRAMETVDREAMAEALFPVLAHRRSEGATEDWLRRVVAATAEGYPFPTDLDLDPPVGGLAPASQADLLWQALSEDWAPGRLRHELAAAHRRRRGH
ncbi:MULTISPECIES: phytanoyl-CoA dioxygenase family protein [Streptomyces]|uniref:Ectoine hydroxylase-related dioxygenase (Phytanoyl-CoA dioxygenase family) n=1 Tax=Streptomyces stelliscabiei TaxID=146820 RepID=A0A8I0NX42_9ACTN|nr:MULTISPECIES: phytanoyl-CoA dioxygenase family protein [Streptomyces]KND45903.1 phytanoyl-CoA dioxygenase [Streptomyces stelliscabiei]MBE1595316.1 ectoine hydroxylase-related dioxygenase (phytanoyl-CoA dioxygenase family) [Streptomyces stelliscabiei]MDX2516271.1 phytanoyl-CoA dioxygenase family protein [Streptomyces stelliscabiei]MDX2557876.1 phytanoyl-CoA dioxygenase family protein [Streptomyces stelliscabiei]MDX2612230.1 phytanoyl-CoA dioxygenase family protein [Streptomyces stelliscabiei